MASTYISRAATGSVTSDKTFTISHWIKRASGLGSTQYFFMHENASSHTQKIGLDFTTANKIRMSWWDGSNEYNLDTTRIFRDTSGWYNFVFRFDSTQSTASNRVRFYVNGQLEEITNANGSSPTYPGQNATMNLGQKIMVHGRYQSSSPGSYFDGSLSHIHYCDGQSYAPTEFGETDSTTGEWRIKGNPSLTYGNNGYFILKDGNSVTNQAGNSSGNFSVSGGTLTNTEDCPSDVFATWNPLLVYVSEIPTFSEGNTKVSPTGNSSRNYAISTIAMPRTGKWYSEFKKLQNDNVLHIGILDTDIATARFQANAYVKDNAGGLVYDTVNGNISGNNTNQQTSLATSGNGDIIGLAIDMDNDLFYAYKNGTLLNTSGTGVNFSSFITGSDVAFFVGDGSSSGYDSCQANFGNGYFGTTAIASEGTNASNIGKFEYDVPTGYTALSTKGLNS